MHFSLCQLGARPLVDLTLADEQHELGVDGALEIFKRRLFQVLEKMQFYEVSENKVVFDVDF